MDKLGQETPEKIDWNLPCVRCIANDFNKYDLHAVNQMQRNIKLIRYKNFSKKLILFESLNTQNLKQITENVIVSKKSDKPQDDSFTGRFQKAPEKLKNLYTSVKDYILSLGDDIDMNTLKQYIAFKKIKNIVCIHIMESTILVNLSIASKSVTLQHAFIRDMTGIGHFGTGKLRITIKNLDDFEKAKPYIDKAYLEG